jgi:hypothetical protein
MTTESQPQTRKPARRGISLDAWAVGLALGEVVIAELTLGLVYGAGRFVH